MFNFHWIFFTQTPAQVARSCRAQSWCHSHLWCCGLLPRRASPLTCQLKGKKYRTCLILNHYHQIRPVAFSFHLLWDHARGEVVHVKNPFTLSCVLVTQVLMDAVLKTNTHHTILPFHSHKWPRQNFSLQYQYNIKQAGDENREEYQSWD